MSDEEKEQAGENGSAHETRLFSLPPFALSAQLIANLHRRGLTISTQVQYEAIPKIQDERGKDICVNAPTGSGKTLAYALPITQVDLWFFFLTIDSVNTTVQCFRMSRGCSNARTSPTSPRSIRYVCKENGSSGERVPIHG